MAKQIEDYPKWVQKIGYWLYLIVRPFYRLKPQPDKVFKFITEGVNLPISKPIYRNKHKVFCVEYTTNGYNLILGDGKSHLLLRLHSKKAYVDKTLPIKTKERFVNGNDIAGTVNSMIISLIDKEKKASLGQTFRIKKGIKV